MTDQGHKESGFKGDAEERALLRAAAEAELRAIESVAGPMGNVCSEAIRTAFKAGSVFGLDRAKACIPISNGNASRDTERLKRFAGIALAVEGKDEGFGSQLAASRELDFVREDFLSRHAQGDDAYTAFCYAIDQIMPKVSP